MARPISNGLEYFPLDTDFFDDPKLLHAEEAHGLEGGYIAIRILCWIYREGYCIEWNQDTSVIFTRRLGNRITSDTVTAVVQTLLKHGFFSRIMYQKFAILTSRGIQNRWLGIIKHAKRKASIKTEYDLTDGINSIESELVREETTPIPDVTTPIPELSTESKVKESKVKESKVKKNKEMPGKPAFDPLSIFLPYTENEFTEAWASWVIHRKEVKVPLTEQAVKKQLKSFDGLDVSVAVAMIDKAISSGWKSFFPLNEQDLERLRKPGSALLTQARRYLNDKFHKTERELKEDELALRNEYYGQKAEAGSGEDIHFPRQISEYYSSFGQADTMRVIL